MTIEFKPLGNSCNLACTYCYQEPMRLAGNARTSGKYDIEKMIEIADKEIDRRGDLRNSETTVFGGESLLIPIKDLEKLLKYSFEKQGSSSIQSNGSLVNEKHIALFKKYNTQVGISIDGPNELNGLRVSASNKISTNELTKKTMDNIAILRYNGIRVGIIITLHRLNALDEHLPRLKSFIKWLQEVGIHSGIIHLMEVDSQEVRDKYTLSTEESINAALSLAKFFDENPSLKYAPFNEFEDMQKGIDSIGCVLHNCDPLNTQAVFGVEGNGSISNCGMVNKEGIEWTKSDSQVPVRAIINAQVPQDKGGCQGCNYFMMCNSYCPGSSIDGDWRNKTEHCTILKAMFKHYEEKVESQGITPLSKYSTLNVLTNRYVEHLMNGRPISLKNLLEEPIYLSNTF